MKLESITIDLTDDMYVGCLPSECIEDFVCMLCYGIVIDPIKCSTCETLFCKNCFLMSRKMKFGRKQKLEFSCYKKCGSTSFSFKLDRQEQQILNDLEFQCQNEECEDKIPLKDYVRHCKKDCKVQTYQNVFKPGQ